MQWFRLYHEFATDPKVQCLSETLQRRYIMLLCLKCNNEIPGLSDEEIACSLRISEDEAAETKRKLIGKGLIDESWNPTAWDKRQYVSDTSTSRVQKYRDKLKSIKLDTDTDTEEKSLQKQKGNVTETFHEPKEPLNDFQQALVDFEEMRKKIKKPLTDRARAMMLTELNKLSSDEQEQIAILNQSTMNCWKGVFELQNKQNNGGSKRGKTYEEIIAEGLFDD